MVMRSRRLPRRPFHADSPRARGPVLALSPPAPSLPCARPCGCGGGTRCAKPLRHRSREIGAGYRAAGRFRRRPTRSAAGTSCSGATPLRPGLHAPPPRRSSAIAGGLRHRGGFTPSRHPQHLSAGHLHVAEPPELSWLKCAGHHHKGNTGSNALQMEQFLVCRVTSRYNHRFTT